MTERKPALRNPEPPYRFAGDGGPDTDDWRCSCGLWRPVTGSYGCADCGDGRPDSWDRIDIPDYNGSKQGVDRL